MSEHLERLRHSDLGFTLKLAEIKRAIMLPGLIFGSAGRGYLRITFVTMNGQEIEEGFKLLREYLEENNAI